MIEISLGKESTRYEVHFQFSACDAFFPEQPFCSYPTIEEARKHAGKRFVDPSCGITAYQIVKVTSSIIEQAMIE